GARFGYQARTVGKELLDLDLSTGCFELLLDVLGLFLANAFLDGLRSALDEVLGFLEAETRDLAHDLDRVDLVRAGVRQNHGELRLLLGSRSSSRCASARSGRDGNGSRADAPLRLELLHELGDLDDGEVGKVIDDLLFGNFSHDNLHAVPRLPGLGKRGLGFRFGPTSDASPALLLALLRREDAD